MKLLTIQMVAKRLNCSTTRIYRLITQGDIPCFRTGPAKGYAIPEEELTKFMDKRKEISTISTISTNDIVL